MGSDSEVPGLPIATITAEMKLIGSMSPLKAITAQATTVTSTDRGASGDRGAFGSEDGGKSLALIPAA